LKSISFFKRITAAKTSLRSFPKTWIGVVLVAIVIGKFAIPNSPSDAAVGINNTINYQGRLLNASGAVVADGNYNMRFKIYKDGDGTVAGNTAGAPAGTLLWTEKRENFNSQGIVVKNGYFNVSLGTLCAFTGGSCQGNTNTAIDFNLDTLFLSADIGGTSVGATPTYDGEMLPMKRLSASPYALNAGKVGGLASSQLVQLAQGVQTDASTTAASIFINKTGTTASILELQRGDTDVLLVDNAGLVTFRPNADNANALKVLNAANTEQVLSVDTTARSATGGNIVKIGNSTGTDTATTILQVDSAASDPTTNLTALNGGLFYNSGTSLLKVIAGNAVATVCTTVAATCNATYVPGTSGSYIQNQNAGAQSSSNFNISGTGTADSFTSVTSHISPSYTGTGAVSVSSGAASALGIDSGTTGALNIGTGSNAKSITIGNNTGATAIIMQSGTGDIALQASGNNVKVGNAVSNTYNAKFDVEQNFGAAPTNASGNFAVGSNSRLAVTGSANNDGSAFAGINRTDISGTNSLQSAYGTYSQVLNGATAGTVTNAYGAYSQAVNNNSGAASNLYGFTSDLQLTGTGNVSNAIGFNATSPTRSGAGTITNAYGLVVLPQKITGVTNGFGVYQQGTNDINYFAGNVGIGTGGATYNLDVQGTSGVRVKTTTNSATALLVQNAGGYSALALDTTSSTLKVYENVATPTNFASISYAGGAAIFAASSGITQIGNGTGNVTANLTNANDIYSFNKTYTPVAAYSLNDFSVSRTLTGAANSLTGSVLKVEDLSSGSAAAPNVLYVNQNNASATGNLIVAKTTGTTTRFSVDTLGNVNAGNGFQIGTTASSGNYLRGNGTSFVSSAILSGDIPSGSGNYIQNQTGGAQAAANFWISGGGVAGSFSASNYTSSSATALALDSGTTGAINIGTSAYAKTITIGNIQATTSTIMQGGATKQTIANAGETIQTTTNSATAFQIQDASANNLFTADTSTNALTLGSAIAQGAQTPTFVRQSTNFSNTSVSSLSISHTSTAGNFLVATVGVESTADNTAAVSSITDTAGNNWIKAVRGYGNAGASSRVEIWYAANAQAVTSITINLTTPDDLVSNISEYSGVASSSPLDVAAGNTSGATSTSAATPSITTTSANDLVIASTSWATTATTTGAGAPYTSLTQVANTFPKKISPAYRVLASAGATNAAWTLSTSAISGNAIVAFKAQGAAGVGTKAILTGNLGIGTNYAAATLDVAGNAHFKNTTDSTTAFQIQNSAGANVLAVDTLNGNLALNGSNNGTVGSFTDSPSTLPLGRNHMGSAYYNGYMYLVGGTDGTSVFNTIFYARANADGSVGAWTTNTNNYPQSLDDVRVVAVNGYLYIVGGQTVGGTRQTTVYYGKINSDGSISAFQTSPNGLPTASASGQIGTYNGYIYLMGGSAVGTEVYYAKINPDGSTAAWATSANALPVATIGNSGGIANGYLYSIGGSNLAGSTVYSAIYYAKINIDGTTSAFAATTVPIPTTLRNATSVFANGYLYLLGGSTLTTSSPTTTIYYAPLAANGNITTAFTTNSNSLLAVRNFASSVFANGYIYELGGSDGVVFQPTVWYGSTARITLNGSVDLVGPSGNNLSEGNTGGSLTAGNTNIVGTLSVQGYGSFNNALSTSGTLTVNTSTTGYAAAISNASVATNAGVPATSSDGLLINLGTANASRTTGNYFVGFAGGGTVAGKIQGCANAVACTSNGTGPGVSYTTTGADYAEHFRVVDTTHLPQPGELVTLDNAGSHSVHTATQGNGTLIGVISTSPGFVGNGPLCNLDDNDCDKNYAKYNVLVALNGQVPTKVTVANGAIKIGDPITSSSQSGVGQKATTASTIVGFALEPATSDGTIKVVIQPQFFDPSSGSNIQNGSTATLSALNVTGQLDASSLNISGLTSLHDLSVSGSITLAKDLTVGGTTNVADIVINGHVITAGNTPSVQLMLAAGINAVATVSGNDSSGTITLTIGDPQKPATTKTAAILGPEVGDLVHILFSSPYKKEPQVTLTAANADAASMKIFRTSDIGYFAINTVEIPKPNTVYIYDYFVRQ
jgi:hypothetical protein